MTIDLSKNINLVKKVLTQKNIVDIKGHISMVVDISVSMSGFYNRGVVQELAERILAVGMNMDVDQQIDVYLFGEKAHRAESVTLDNIEGYVHKEIENKFKLEGSTNYSTVMSLIAEDLNYKTPSTSNSPKGLFKKLLGSAKHVFNSRQESMKDDAPSIVFFITDGDNFDKSSTTTLIQELAHKPVFWQFIGIGNSDFKYLKGLDNMSGRYIDNANFFEANDISNITDNELYDRILGELPDWVQEARQKGLIK